MAEAGNRISSLLWRKSEEVRKDVACARTLSCMRALQRAIVVERGLLHLRFPSLLLVFPPPEAACRGWARSGQTLGQDTP
eukprot:766741-Hanusia_phi.AAC.6